MTATSHDRRQAMRLSSMETLGFIDPPPTSWTSPPNQSVSAPSFPEPVQTTELVSLPVGRHTRPIEPTGELVKDIWDSTELHAPSLLDWAPQTFSAKTLGTRNFRWSVLFLFLIGLVVAGGIGYWLYRQPSNSLAAASSRVTTEAEALSEVLEQAAPLVTHLDDERLPEANQDAAVFFEVGELARVMFAASADLPESDTSDRSAAADAAGLALDASRQLMDATAYRTALEPALTLPGLETDPAMTDITTATEAFTAWRSEFEVVHDALPGGVEGQASAALDELSDGLDTTQTAYLDALRRSDSHAAVEALGGLRAELQSVHHALLVDMGRISSSVSDLLDQAQARLNLLLG